MTADTVWRTLLRSGVLSGDRGRSQPSANGQLLERDRFYLNRDSAFGRIMIQDAG